MIRSSLTIPSDTWEQQNSQFIAEADQIDSGDSSDEPLIHVKKSAGSTTNSSFRTRLKTLHGPDKRRNICDVGDAESTQVRLQSKSVAMLVHQDDLLLREDGSYKIKGDRLTTLKTSKCINDGKFIDEPIPQGGIGTAFLVGQTGRIALTAAHCVEENGVEKYRLVFDHQMNTQNHDILLGVSFSPEQVFKFKVARMANDENNDWAVLKLKRAANQNGLTIATPPLKKGKEIYMIGHPDCLPMKYAGDAKIAELIRDMNAFRCNLDAFGGNSGSPVFDKITGKVIGILVEGGLDYCRARNGEIVLYSGPMDSEICQRITPAIRNVIRDSNEQDNQEGISNSHGSLKKMLFIQVMQKAIDNYKILNTPDNMFDSKPCGIMQLSLIHGKEGRERAEGYKRLFSMQKGKLQRLNLLLHIINGKGNWNEKSIKSLFANKIKEIAEPLIGLPEKGFFETNQSYIIKIINLLREKVAPGTRDINFVKEIWQPKESVLNTDRFKTEMQEIINAYIESSQENSTVDNGSACSETTICSSRFDFDNAGRHGPSGRARADKYRYLFRIQERTLQQLNLLVHIFNGLGNWYEKSLKTKIAESIITIASNFLGENVPNLNPDDSDSQKRDYIIEIINKLRKEIAPNTTDTTFSQ